MKRTTSVVVVRVDPPDDFSQVEGEAALEVDEPIGLIIVEVVILHHLDQYLSSYSSKLHIDPEGDPFVFWCVDQALEHLVDWTTWDGVFRQIL